MGERRILPARIVSQYKMVRKVIWAEHKEPRKLKMLQLCEEKRKRLGQKAQEQSQKTFGKPQRLKLIKDQCHWVL